tara:strand:+ start:90 stop:296 length:207 start_codon:yes stop_codon:yes gene_type:complete
MIKNNKIKTLRRIFTERPLKIFNFIILIIIKELSGVFQLIGFKVLPTKRIYFKKEVNYEKKGYAINLY